MTPTLREAYRHCEQVTRSQARNFAWGILLLPHDQRRALCAVYALARRIDDIGDGDLFATRKLAELQQLRGQSTAAGPRAATRYSRRSGTPHVAFRCRWAPSTICSTAWRGTCAATRTPISTRSSATAGGSPVRSAGSASAFTGAPTRKRFAGPTTSALRFSRPTSCGTSGRTCKTVASTFLARSWLRQASRWQIGRDGRLGAPTGQLVDYLRSCAQRAAEWYDIGLGVLDALDRRSAACTAAMAGIYRRLNERFVADPTPILERRLSLPGREKATVAVRALAGRRP